MFPTVEKEQYTGPVKFGIGTEKQERALLKFGCVKVFFPHELDEIIDMRNIDLHWMLRHADTIVMAQPSLLPLSQMRKIAATGVSWQVPGHEPVRFNSDEERAAWRKQKPKGVRIATATTRKGRKPKWPVPTKEQVAAMVALWYSGQKPALILPQVQEMMGAEVPMSWLRDQIIKKTGSARRRPE